MCIRLPPNVKAPGILWKINKINYDISWAGRQWVTCNEQWLLESAAFQQVPSVSQLYVWRNDSKSIRVLLIESTENLSIIGDVSVLSQFMNQTKKCFDVSKIIIDDDMLFNGCHILQSLHGDLNCL